MKKTLILCAAALTLGIATPVMARDYDARDCNARRADIERKINYAHRHQSQYQVNALRAQLNDVNRLCRGDRVRGDDNWRHVRERDDYRRDDYRRDDYRRDGYRRDGYRSDRDADWRGREVERQVERAIDDWLR